MRSKTRMEKEKDDIGKIPKTIYLQYYNEYDGDVSDEITWSEEKIFHDDIEYVLKEEEEEKK